ncbi:MAG TPA: ABC transporter permease [Solirubrobacteraceae bacterium]|nr:ABC transporter permease [Solirubrobacteraceae bacterium]
MYRAERRKLLAQLSTRVLVLVCTLGPAVFAVILRLQSGVPADTLLGVWVHSSGYAIPFVVLGFGGFWGFPVLAGVLAGDLFSSEDRYGTWKTILTRSPTRKDVFAGKVLAAMTLTAALVALAGLSSLLAGLLLTGDQPLVGLGGTVIPSGECLLLVLVSWLVVLLPVLAFTSLAVLFSVATRNGIMGVLGPVLTGLLMQLLALIGTGTWVHLLLVASAFGDWHGLLAADRFYGPLIISSCVCAAWAMACLGTSWLILRRRNFAGTPVARQRGWVAPARAVLAVAALIVVLGIASNWGPVAITKPRLEASITSSFNRLTRLQQEQLGRSLATAAELDDRAICRRRSSKSDGPGDDWSCAITIATPRAGALETVGYDVSVESDGCYKADAPTSFVGQQMMSDARGHSVVNPLFTIYGCFDIVSAPPCARTATCGQTSELQRSGHPTAAPGDEAEAQRLHEAERIAGPTVMRKINKADAKAARESTRPGPEEAEPPAREARHSSVR